MIIIPAIFTTAAAAVVVFIVKLSIFIQRTRGQKHDRFIMVSQHVVKCYFVILL